MKARGTRGIMSLGRAFKIYDDNGDKTLQPDEARKALHELRVGLTPEEEKEVFRVFDEDRSGTIDYEEFLRHIRGSMNEFRKGICMKAFGIMDKDHNGVIDIKDIKDVYNAKKHPKVMSGQKTEDEILFEFLDTFEQHHSSYSKDERDHRVTPSEWIEYYNHVSMSIDRDDYFEAMMNSAWNFDGSRVNKRGTRTM